ncbi:geranylgeranyl reductase family protein [Iamia sp. SCSIO 61187]|uniref:NAD(P)/FAD-dependent oxidoreductase n=1 Tax=Iamia sp. SCSIO 61187 TaxID=2722752 RepID=UPI001C625C7F|nr:geranylgeranyl reductase family protein [Iamia sp. SCSIO 61187]QYG93834.1 geranylgeranyl reductase family protein [Iamia sp. SCSIO 61187]
MSESDLDVDVLVVGGGPGGAAAAVALARAGREVVVVDKATFPRDKICGDGLTTGALHHLEHIGVDPGRVASWRTVDTMEVVTPSGEVRTLPFPQGQGAYAAVARRIDLDAEVLDAARRAGATVHAGHALCRVAAPGSADEPFVGSVTGLGTVRARHVVGADGMWSPLRKAMGLAVPGYRGDCHAFRQYLRGVDAAALDALWVWFEPDVLPGYAWSFPLGDGSVNVGFGIHRGGRMGVSEMGEVWRSLLRRPALTRVLGTGWEAEGPPRAWPIPARLGALPLAHGRALFVGDAAGACDPMTGEGIGQALASGLDAAAAVLAGRSCDPAGIAAAYETTLRRGLVRDNAMAARLLPLLRRRQGAEAAVRVASATPWVRQSFARWLFEDYPRALVLTPHRWHRGAFTGPGSYR